MRTPSLRNCTAWRLPTPSNASCALSPPRCNCAVPSAVHCSKVPSSLMLALPAISVWPSLLRQRSPLACSVIANAVCAASPKAMLPSARTWPLNASTTSGCRRRVCCSTLSWDGCNTSVVSPCWKRPCTVALPPTPVALSCSATGVAVCLRPASNSTSNAALLACNCQCGAVAGPCKFKWACSGAGAWPVKFTLSEARSPCACNCSCGALCPAGAGSTALARRSLR